MKKKKIMKTETRKNWLFCKQRATVVASLLFPYIFYFTTDWAENFYLGVFGGADSESGLCFEVASRPGWEVGRGLVGERPLPWLFQ